MNIQGVTPMINAPMQAQATSSNGTSGSNNTGNSSLSSGNLQATFLNLLVTELQNQDPTQPVDPTAMVGQMVSLNELDQLISINQTLTSLTGGSGTGAQSSLASNPASDANANAAKTENAPGTAFTTQPAAMNTPIPGGLMNLYGNIAAANINSTNYTTQGGR